MMVIKFQETEWHTFPGLALEDPRLRVVVVPEAGGRIVSLFDRARGHEWLVAPQDSHPFRKFDYGAAFNPLTPGGWDEMFPTILAGNYPGPGSFSGAPLPDHGELWTQSWSVEVCNENEIRLSVEGRALPYRLTRSLSLSSEGIMALRYTLANPGSDPLYFLWAAHPQFRCTPGMRIVLPETVRAVVNVLPLEWGPEWGPPGTRNPWPEFTSPAGKVLRQDIVGSPALKQGRKFYLLPDESIAWAGLEDPGSGAGLRMEWDPAALPYCGIWIDEGALNSVATVAIEPTHGYYDDLFLAWTQGRLASLEPQARCQWEIFVLIN